MIDNLMTFCSKENITFLKINGYRANPHGIPTKHIPEKVLERIHHVGREVKSHKEYYSMSFPINLPSLCGTAGYLYFSSGEESFPQLSSTVTLIIRTNRGREVQKKLPLGNLHDDPDYCYHPDHYRHYGFELHLVTSLFFPFCWVYKHNNMVSQQCQVLFVCLPNFLLTRFTSRVIMSLQGRNGKQ